MSEESNETTQPEQELDTEELREQLRQELRAELESEFDAKLKQVKRNAKAEARRKAERDLKDQMSDNNDSPPDWVADLREELAQLKEQVSTQSKQSKQEAFLSEALSRGFKEETAQSLVKLADLSDKESWDSVFDQFKPLAKPAEASAKTDVGGAKVEPRAYDDAKYATMTDEEIISDAIRQGQTPQGLEPLRSPKRS